MAYESDEKKNEILDLLAELFSTETREHWVGLLRGADMVAVNVNTMLEASVDPNVVDNGYVDKIYHEESDQTLTIHGSPWKFAETPRKPIFAPNLGEHNSEILGTIGYDEGQIERLENDEVI